MSENEPRNSWHQPQVSRTNGEEGVTTEIAWTFVYALRKCQSHPLLEQLHHCELDDGCVSIISAHTHLHVYIYKSCQIAQYICDNQPQQWCSLCSVMSRTLMYRRCPRADCRVLASVPRFRKWVDVTGRRDDVTGGYHYRPRI